MTELNGRGNAEAAEPRHVLRREQLPVLDPLPQAERAPGVLRRLERVERLAVRAVANRVDGDGKARGGAGAHDLLELLAARDLDARPVEHPRRLRAERPVHERLQVAELEQRPAEPAADVGVLELARLLGRQRLPDAETERPFPLEPLPEAQRAEPAVLVVHGRDPARRGEADAGAHRRHVLVVGDVDVRVAEVPARLLAQDAGRLALLVELDDTAGDLQVAVRARQGGRVEPERMRVARHQRHRPVGYDLVQRLLGRLDRRRPVAAPPAAAAQPGALRVGQRLAYARERLVHRPGVLESHLVLRDRPGREVHVRVGESREYAAPPEVDALRPGKRRLVRADAAGDPFARDRERAHDRQRCVERTDDAVLEYHAARI